MALITADRERFPDTPWQLVETRYESDGAETL